MKTIKLKEEIYFYQLKHNNKKIDYFWIKMKNTNGMQEIQIKKWESTKLKNYQKSH